LKRKLFNLASVASLAFFCLSSATLYGMGRWGQRGFLRLFGPWECSAEITHLGVQILVFHNWSTPVIGPVAATGQAGNSQYFAYQNSFPHRLYWHGPFGFAHGTTAIIRNNRLQAVGTRTWVMFPFRLYAAVFLLLPALRFVIFPTLKRIRRPLPAGLCRKCRYDLTGNTSGICPECGSPTPSPEKATA